MIHLPSLISILPGPSYACSRLRFSLIVYSRLLCFLTLDSTIQHDCHPLAIIVVAAIPIYYNCPPSPRAVPDLDRAGSLLGLRPSLTIRLCPRLSSRSRSGLAPSDRDHVSPNRRLGRDSLSDRTVSESS